MTDDRAILEESLRRAARWQPVSELFAQQRKFVLDPARFKAALCTRRAGKSKACANYLLKSALARPGAICLYVALTRLSAKRIMWRELVKMNAKHRLGVKVNLSELSAELPNGSQVILAGADDEADIEKWRGSAYDLVVIDEAGSMGAHLEALVREVLQPALMDHKGSMVLIGTPNSRCAGWFHDVTTGRKQGWSLHRWTVLDNVFIPDAKDEIELVKQQFGWDEQTPAFLREYRGLWVRSDDDLVYSYDPTRNDFDELPGDVQVWNHVLGVDVGFRDRTAFTVLAWSDECPAAYVVHAEAHRGLIPSAIAERIVKLRSDWTATDLVMDCGALGLSLAEEFRQRWHLPIEAAVKTEKLGAIELVNGDFKAGRLFVRADSPLAEELRVLQYDTRSKLRDPNARREDPQQPNDLCDSFLYAYRHCRHFRHSVAPAKPLPGSQAWALGLRPRPTRNDFGAEPGPGAFDDFGPGGDSWD